MAQPDAVDVQVGNKNYRLVASADRATLLRLAAIVDSKLRAVGSRHPDALVLTAIALAHEIERLEAENRRQLARSREMLKTLLARVDDALEYVDENGDPLPTPAASSNVAEF
jgi:cell division protein ZapA